MTGRESRCANLATLALCLALACNQQQLVCQLPENESRCLGERKDSTQSRSRRVCSAGLASIPVTPPAGRRSRSPPRDLMSAAPMAGISAAQALDAEARAIRAAELHAKLGIDKVQLATPLVDTTPQAGHNTAPLKRAF